MSSNCKEIVKKFTYCIKYTKYSQKSLTYCKKDTKYWLVFYKN